MFNTVGIHSDFGICIIGQGVLAHVFVDFEGHECATLLIKQLAAVKGALCLNLTFTNSMQYFNDFTLEYSARNGFAVS
ncbi:hypothetical protein A1OS_03825 [Enterovibrio norvegicus]|nr:hypothetical protein A1OS_03825 [Enterovibrio norvegicus]